ncbi:MAG: HNH endonuclease signature motif containing protein [Aeromonas sobria]
MYKELLDYSEGILRWKSRRGRIPAGAVAGCRDGGGYISVSVHGKMVRAHRIVYEMHFGRIPDGAEIDHINGIRHDNRIENLRLTSRSVNNRNKAKQRNNTSGVTGVCWHTRTGKWQAIFMSKYLGLFETIEEAKSAYKAASHGIVTSRHGA